MYYIRKTVTISSAHFLPDYKGKCCELHGHNWKVTVFCRSKKLDKHGMVIDFARIKTILSEFDHHTLNSFVENPTAENIARHICLMIPHCYRVEVEENEGSVAVYEQE